MHVDTIEARNLSKEEVSSEALSEVLSEVPPEVPSSGLVHDTNIPWHFAKQQNSSNVMPCFSISPKSTQQSNIDGEYHLHTPFQITPGSTSAALRIVVRVARPQKEGSDWVSQVEVREKKGEAVWVEREDLKRDIPGGEEKEMEGGGRGRRWKPPLGGVGVGEGGGAEVGGGVEEGSYDKEVTVEEQSLFLLEQVWEGVERRDAKNLE